MNPSAPSPWHVLFVPDSIYWATGMISREIAKHNPWILPSICSTRVLKKILSRDQGLVERIDLVHFLDPWAPVSLQDAFSNRVPSVGSIHHLEPQVVEANEAMDVIALGSRQWLDDLRSTVAHERLELIPYGVDTNRFHPADAERRRRSRRRLDLSPDAFVVGFFSKRSSDHGDRKGIDVLLAGLDRLRARVPRATALIVGPGWAPMIEKLRTAAITCRWIPYVLDEEPIVDMYHALDVYWVTARVEGGPLTLLEAMSCGICCVSTPVGIAPEVAVDGVNACVVSVGDVGELVRRTEVLASDDSLRERMGAAARATVCESRHWRVTTGGVREVYSRARQRFRERTGRTAMLRTRPTARAFGFDRSPYPLDAVAPPLRRWARMLEIFYWMNEGDFDHCPRVARRLAWRACRANPGSREPWARLLRLVHPRAYRLASELFR